MQRKALVLCSNLSVNSLGKIYLDLMDRPGHCLFFTACVQAKQIYFPDFLTGLSKAYCAVYLSVKSLPVGKIYLDLTDGSGHCFACFLLLNNLLVRERNKFNSSLV